MKVRDLLAKYKLLSKKIEDVDFHMSLLKYDMKFLEYKIPELAELSEQEKVQYILKIYDRCDELSPNYDQALDEQMVRICLRTNEYYAPKTDPDSDDLYEENYYHNR